jgi:hypothetical protein
MAACAHIRRAARLGANCTIALDMISLPLELRSALTCNNASYSKAPLIQSVGVYIHGLLTHN